MMQEKAKELAKEDPFFEEFAKMEYRGNMSSMLIRTKQGRTLNIQHDATSPSPHNLIHGVYGTEGSVLYDPAPPRICTGNHKWADKEIFDELMEKSDGKLQVYMDFRLETVDEIVSQIYGFDPRRLKFQKGVYLKKTGCFIIYFR